MNNDWITPPDVIKLVRKLMNEIDLDPASSELANSVVGARKYYTSEENGILLPWSGNVWLNPPYGKGCIQPFINKALVEISNVKQMCILTNNSTDTTWGQELLNACNAVSFFKSRLSFLDLELIPCENNRFGQMLCYFGHNSNEFLKIFRVMGSTWKNHGE